MHLFITPRTLEIERKLAERCWPELRDGLFLGVSTTALTGTQVRISLNKCPYLRADPDFPDVYVEVITNPNEIPADNTELLFKNISEAFDLHGSSVGYTVEITVRDTSVNGNVVHHGRSVR